MGEVQLLDPATIRPHPANPRQDPGDVTALAEAIARDGILNELVVTPAPDGGWWAVCGSRRTAAARQLGLDVVPCKVREDLDDLTAGLTALGDHAGRRELNPIEEARAYARLLDAGLTQSQLAERVGATQAHVSRYTRLLELPDQAQAQVASGELSLNKALALLPKAPTRSKPHSYPAKTAPRRTPRPAPERAAATTGVLSEHTVTLPPDAMKAARRCAVDAGIDVTTWVVRAISAAARHQINHRGARP